MLQSTNRWRIAFFAALIGSTILTGCRETQVDPTAPTTTTPTLSGAVTDQEVNNWILSNMRTNYYWFDKIPASPNLNQTPDKFFDSILYKFDRVLRPDGDRFSWIQQSAEALKASLSGSGKATGAEYELRRVSNSDNVVMKIRYVLPGTPAEQAGIQRGDFITRINGQTLTLTNYQTLVLGDIDTKTYTIAKTDATGTLTEQAGTKTITAVTLQENPIYKDTVLNVASKKIGYLVYNAFVDGPYRGDQTLYNRQLDNVFGKFKSQGVTELVVDLRYNGGGSGLAANHLASLIGKNIDASKLFYRTEYNTNVASAYRQQYGQNFDRNNFIAKANNIGGSLNRVFVLTLDGTASASELVINGLKPYMSVVTVGDTTYGKNVGSQTIEDQTGRIKWGLQPIMMKVFNASNQSDYTNGFAPSQVVFEPRQLVPFGNVTDPLLSEAIFQITGTRTARRAARDDADNTPVLGSSLDRKATNHNLWVKEPGQR